MKPRLKIIFAMVLFGTIGAFVRNIPLPSGTIALFRAIIAFVSIAAYRLASGKRIQFAAIKKSIPLLLISGTAMGLNWILFFESFRYTTVSIATLSYYFAPVLVMVACPILFHEKYTPGQIVCFLLSTAGFVLIICSGSGGKGIDDMKGIRLGLGAAAFYAAVILLNKSIKDVNGIDRTLLQIFASILVLIPYVYVAGGINPFATGRAGMINLLIVGTVHTGFAYCLYFSVLKDLKGHEAALLSYIDPLVAVLVSVTVLRESITVPQLIGGAMILGFTGLYEYRPWSRRLKSGEE